MKSHAELLEDFNHAGVSFMLTELEVASSFTNVAMGPYAFERKQRLLLGALRAYRQALSMRHRFRLTPDEDEKFRRISASVGKSLAGFGLKAPPVPEARKAA